MRLGQACDQVRPLAMTTPKYVPQDRDLPENVVLWQDRYCENARSQRILPCAGAYSHVRLARCRNHSDIHRRISDDHLHTLSGHRGASLQRLTALELMAGVPVEALASAVLNEMTSLKCSQNGSNFSEKSAGQFGQTGSSGD